MVSHAFNRIYVPRLLMPRPDRERRPHIFSCGQRGSFSSALAARLLSLSCAITA